MTRKKRDPRGAALFVETLAQGPDDEAADFPRRLRRYGQAHARTKAMIAHIRGLCQGAVVELSPQALAARLDGCGNYLVFRDYYTVGKIRLAGARFCKTPLLCPLCAARRGAKLVAAYLKRWQVLQARNPRLTPYLVTFTVKNTATLKEGYDHVVTAYQVLMKRRRDFVRRGIGWTEAARALGGVYSIELTRTEQGWHPHIHAVWLCEHPPGAGWVKPKTGRGGGLRKEWFDLTGDSFEVDVRPIAGNSPDELARGFAEVFKYAVKFADLSLEDNWTAYQELQTRRLVGSFGCLRGVVVPDTLADDLLDDLPYIELFYHYLLGRGYCPRWRERKEAAQ